MHCKPTQKKFEGNLGEHKIVESRFPYLHPIIGKLFPFKLASAPGRKILRTAGGGGGQEQQFAMVDTVFLFCFLQKLTR
jgi:hypothetical protein